MSSEPNAQRDIIVDERLFDLYDSMLGDVEIPNVLRDVADVVCKELDAERASIYLIDEETEELQAVAMVGNVASTIRIPRPHSGYMIAQPIGRLLPPAPLLRLHRIVLSGPPEGNLG